MKEVQKNESLKASQMKMRRFLLNLKLPTPPHVSPVTLTDCTEQRRTAVRSPAV